MHIFFYVLGSGLPSLIMNETAYPILKSVRSKAMTQNAANLDWLTQAILQKIAGVIDEIG